MKPYCQRRGATPAALLRRDGIYSPEHARWIWRGSKGVTMMMVALNDLDYQYDGGPRLREFGAWCVRQVWDKLADPRSRRAVEVAERYARDDASVDDLVAAQGAAVDAIPIRSRKKAYPAKAAAEAAVALCAWNAWDAAHGAFWSAIMALDEDVRGAAEAAQADKLRELIPWEAVEPLFAAALSEPATA